MSSDMWRSLRVCVLLRLCRLFSLKDVSVFLMTCGECATATSHLLLLSHGLITSAHIILRPPGGAGSGDVSWSHVDGWWICPASAHSELTEWLSCDQGTCWAHAASDTLPAPSLCGCSNKLQPAAMCRQKKKKQRRLSETLCQAAVPPESNKRNQLSSLHGGFYRAALLFLLEERENGLAWGRGRSLRGVHCVSLFNICL